MVCPSIEPGEDEALKPEGFSDFISTSDIRKNIKNAVEHAETLRQNLKNIRIEVLHGRMKPTEKDAVMSRFASGDIDVLVSTTVIEVGVNVPNASLMIVENAERFGLAQLHQLRGRVGRGARKSYCVLVEGIKTEKSSSRLNVMRTTYDGYEIAEKDLLLRGPGDFFSFADSNLRQSGGFDFKLASLCDDNELFTAAFSSAKAIIAEDPELNLPKNARLKQEILRYLPTGYSTIS